MRKLVKIIAIVLTLCCSCFVCGCNITSGEQWTNVIDGYNSADVLTLFLSKGEECRIDLHAQFARYDMHISKITAHSSNNDVFVLQNETVKAIGRGKAKLYVDIYSKLNNLHYYVIGAVIYVSDAQAPDLVEINSVQDLVNINNNRSGNYLLNSDIDLVDYGDWSPIGGLPSVNDDAQSAAFSGTFINPHGYKIKNLSILSVDSLPQGMYGGYLGGLFGRIENAYIDGIVLENVTINLSDSNGQIAEAGGVCATSLNSIVRNCTVFGDIAASDRCGGIVGSDNWGVIIGCQFQGTVKSALSMAGGISACGYIVRDSSVTADIYGAFAAGGILGEAITGDHLSNTSFIGELFCDGYKSESIAFRH